VGARAPQGQSRQLLLALKHINIPSPLSTINPAVGHPTIGLQRARSSMELLQCSCWNDKAQRSSAQRIFWTWAVDWWLCRRDAATGELRIGIFTTRPVSDLEELTYDYMFEHSGVGALARGFKCMCGAKNCRYYLGGRGWGAGGGSARLGCVASGAGLRISRSLVLLPDSSCRSYFQ
jgi:hypothetical protein